MELSEKQIKEAKRLEQVLNKQVKNIPKQVKQFIAGTYKHMKNHDHKPK
jgi:hypothetical protein